MSVQEAIRLDIGCGSYKREGYIGVDAYAETDIKADMGAIPLPDNSVDAIISDHALEHVNKFRTVPVLQEWKRLLKPGGTAEIIVPDLEWCVKDWLWRKTNDWHMDVIFGQQINPGEEHKQGFTYDIMNRYVEAAGMVITHFSVVESHGQPSLRFIVEKPL